MDTLIETERHYGTPLLPPAAPMKLSDAIRAGCALSRPIRCKLFVQEDDGMRTCALGAAILGATGQPAEASGSATGAIRIAAAIFGNVLWDRVPDDPQGGMGSVFIGMWIIHQFDIECQSRESIADQLEAWGY